MKTKSLIYFILRLSLSIGLITWMIYKGMLDFRVLTVLTQPFYLFILIILVFLMIFINNIRWTLLLKSKKFQLGNRQTLPLTFIGLFFNYSLPSGVGGDIVKGYYLLKENKDKKTVAATTILMDRAIGMYGMVLVSTTAILFKYSKIINQSELHVLSLAVITLLLLMSAFFIVAFSKKMKNHPLLLRLFKKIPGGMLIQKIYNSIQSYHNDFSVLMKALILSFITQFFTIFFVWFFAHITDSVIIPFHIYLLIVPLGIISMALPISIAGIGVSQAVIYFLFKIYTGIDTKIGPNAFTALQILLLCWGLLGVYFYVTRKSK